MADYAGTPATTGYVVQTESRGASGVAWAALVLVLILIVIFIIAAIIMFRNRNTDNGNPFWSMTIGTATGTDTFAPDGNDIYIAASRPTSFSVTLNAPAATTLNGRMFMITNVANIPGVILTVVPGTGVVITDNIGSPVNTIPGGKTAQYMWVTNTTAIRLF
jgi:hypothetical protein